MLRTAAVILCLIASDELFAQESANELEVLEMKLANPLADVSSVPLQFNYYFNNDNEVIRTVFNFQPTISVKSEQWVFTNRFVSPFVSNELTSDSTRTQVSGFGDFTYQLYISPIATSGVIYGGGFLLSMPTGMDSSIGSGKWGMGPTLSIIWTSPALTLGGLLYQNWSFAGDKDRKDVNLFTLQPIFSYRLGNFWSVTPFNGITYDGTLKDEQWTLPLGLQVSKLIPRRYVPLHASAGVFSNVIHPEGSPEWLMKLQLTLVL